MNETVVIYSLDRCPDCQKLKKQMDDKNIKYTEITDLETIKGMGFTCVPYLKVGEKILDEQEAIDWVSAQ